MLLDWLLLDVDVGHDWVSLSMIRLEQHFSCGRLMFVIERQQVRKDLMVLVEHWFTADDLPYLLPDKLLHFLHFYLAQDVLIGTVTQQIPLKLEWID